VHALNKDTIAIAQQSVDADMSERLTEAINEALIQADMVSASTLLVAMHALYKYMYVLLCCHNMLTDVFTHYMPIT
jgi:hypothetical protein